MEEKTFVLEVTEKEMDELVHALAKAQIMTGCVNHTANALINKCTTALKEQ